MVAFILHVAFRSETEQNLLLDFNHMMPSAFVLVIETEKLQVHSPTDLLFVVKKLSVKKWVIRLTPYFHYNLWDLIGNLS